MNYVDIKLPLNYSEAIVLVNHLRQNSIDCFLNDAFSASTYIAPGVVTARIMIKKEDLERAQSIVEDFFKK